jgi:GMP synthase-like glutamine amidotransferase
MSPCSTIRLPTIQEQSGRVLERFGASCTYVPVAISDLSVFDPLEPDLLVVLGGAPGVYQSNDYPFLKEEVRILEKRLAHDKPTLGICLGAQLMAAALGASNFKGQQGSERGWSDIQITPEGQNSPVAVFDHSKTKVMQWHQDTFDLPDGATLLATGDVYRNQIFSWGKKRSRLSVPYRGVGRNYPSGTCGPPRARSRRRTPRPCQTAERNGGTSANPGNADGNFSSKLV